MQTSADDIRALSEVVMRTYALLSAAACLGLGAAAGLPRGAVQAPDPATVRLAALVRQLGDNDYGRREAAVRALTELGPQALPALIDAAAMAADPEVRQRADRLVRKLLPGVRKSATTGLLLMAIPTGTFTMGAPNAETGRRPDERPHRVRIARPFYLGAYEVTQEEYAQVMKARPSWFAPTGGGKSKLGDRDSARFPVESVTWFDAVAFCNRLSAQDGLRPYYAIAGEQRQGGTIIAARVRVVRGNGYRLPTEAEWEYACRAGTDTPFHFGTQTQASNANLKAIRVASGYGTIARWRDLGRPAQVGSYAANAWGLRDMHGNVAEWCGDWYDPEYYAGAPTTDPRGPARGSQRVLRGGSWLVTERSARAASRIGQAPGHSSSAVGFRVARDP